MWTHRHLQFAGPRDNAEGNQLDSLPIRWIVEDARKFASREVKRGRSYDLIVLDPPSFGHDRAVTAGKLNRIFFRCLKSAFSY